MWMEVDAPPERRCIVAHAGQKVGFGAAGGLCGGQGIPQELLLARLFHPLGVQNLDQFDGQHIAVERVLHVDDLDRDPVVCIVQSPLLQFHVNLALTVGEPAQNGLAV